jgi:RNA polymerase-binding transcription factor DksA
MTDERWRRLLLDKLGAVCAVIARIKAGQDAALADMGGPGDRGAGATPLDRAESFKRMLNQRLAALSAGDFGLCDSCGLALSVAELDQMPWATRCGDC